MPSCKYCNRPMKQVMDFNTSFAYYRCAHCGSCGPHVKYVDKVGWEEELAMKTLGQSIDVKTPSAEEDLRSRNDILSGRYSKLKSCELPSVNRILREAQQEMMGLQDGREDFDKPCYLEKMATVYKKKATYLKYKAKYEEELRSIKEQIRENKRKLKELNGGERPVNTSAAKELANTVLGEGAVEEADKRIKKFISEDDLEQILIIKIDGKDAIDYFAGLKEEYDLTKLKFVFRSEGQGNGVSYRYYDTSDTVEVYAETIAFTIGNLTIYKLKTESGKLEERYQKLFEVAMDNLQVNNLFKYACGTALLKPVQPINGIAINNLAPGSVEVMLRQKTTAEYKNPKEWEKAHENHENPVKLSGRKVGKKKPKGPKNGKGKAKVRTKKANRS